MKTFEIFHKVSGSQGIKNEKLKILHLHHFLPPFLDNKEFVKKLDTEVNCSYLELEAAHMSLLIY